MQKRFNRIWFIPIFILLSIGTYYLPPVHSRLAWRIELVRTQIKYWINPPDQAVFQPSGKNNPLTVETAIATARAEFLLTLTPASTPTPELVATIEPTITSTPLPATVMLDGVKYEQQHGRLNYCGPANFSMASQ
ncbi:MAG: hypothetical protein HYU84_06170 [Chloroflexi bacterium]|nr:hypothetical protein [Chloroflexota bacterium]